VLDCIKKYLHKVIVEGIKDIVNGLYRFISIGSLKDASQKRKEVLLIEHNIDIDL